MNDYELKCELSETSARQIYDEYQELFDEMLSRLKENPQTNLGGTVVDFSYINIKSFSDFELIVNKLWKEKKKYNIFEYKPSKESEAYIGGFGGSHFTEDSPPLVLNLISYLLQNPYEGKNIDTLINISNMAIAENTTIDYDEDKNDLISKLYGTKAYELNENKLEVIEKLDSLMVTFGKGDKSIAERFCRESDNVGDLKKLLYLCSQDMQTNTREATKKTDQILGIAEKIHGLEPTIQNILILAKINYERGCLLENKLGNIIKLYFSHTEISYDRSNIFRPRNRKFLKRSVELFRARLSQKPCVT